MNGHHGQATIVFYDNEIPVMADLHESTGPGEGLRSWGGTVDLDNPNDALDVVNAGEVTIRLPDGREARMFAQNAVVGSGRLSVGTSSAHFRDETFQRLVLDVESEARR